MALDAGTAAWILASGAATAIGGVGLWLIGARAQRPLMLDALLGFTGGVMLAATVFSLLVPALERGALVHVIAGLAIGGFAMMGGLEIKN